MSYHVVPGAEFQCKVGSYSCRKLSTIDEQDHDVANRKGMINQVSSKTNKGSANIYLRLEPFKPEV